MRIATYYSVVFIAAVALIPWHTIAYSCHSVLPTCLLCVSASRILGPAFGVELSEAYAISAVRYHNGTTLALSKVESTELGKLFRQFELAKEAHQDAEQVVLEGYTASTPSSWDIILATASVFSQLREATSAQHGLDMTEIFLTHLPHKYPFEGNQIVTKAAKLAGIRLIHDKLGDMRPDPVGAAAAAGGIGLCSNYTKLDICCQEESQLPDLQVLGVTYTKAALTVSVSPMTESKEGFEFEFERHWDLGASNHQKDDGYWAKVKQAILRAPGFRRRRPITDVILMGESATDAEFLHTLRDALWELLSDGIAGSGPQPPLARRFEAPEYAAAKGAAVLGKRLMEAPDDCRELALCDWWRRRLG